MDYVDLHNMKVCIRLVNRPKCNIRGCYCDFISLSRLVIMVIAR